MVDLLNAHEGLFKELEPLAKEGEENNIPNEVFQPWSVQEGYLELAQKFEK